ncbi:MAG: glycosyltransferase family 4 protein, partial [Proteobacteria bacterium]|nr:glycosyltransferase family 4 protein [Pseudomonadota bacterium]
SHGISDHVHFLGYRNDVSEIYNTADLFVFMSLKEGLPVAMMEAMSNSKIAEKWSPKKNNAMIITKHTGIDAIKPTIPDTISRSTRRPCFSENVVMFSGGCAPS